MNLWLGKSTGGIFPGGEMSKFLANGGGPPTTTTHRVPHPPSLGNPVVIPLRPFFITFAPEKEIALCLCKLCLNTRMLFEPLMAQSKRDNDMTTELITEFFTYPCEYLKCPNGYYQ